MFRHHPNSTTKETEASKGKGLIQGHLASQWQSPNSNRGPWAAECKPLTLGMPGNQVRPSGPEILPPFPEFEKPLPPSSPAPLPPPPDTHAFIARFLWRPLLSSLPLGLWFHCCCSAELFQLIPCLPSSEGSSSPASSLTAHTRTHTHSVLTSF